MDIDLDNDVSDTDQLVLNLRKSLEDLGLDTSILNNIKNYTSSSDKEDLEGTEELPESLVEEIMLTIYSDDLGESNDNS